MHLLKAIKLKLFRCDVKDVEFLQDLKLQVFSVSFELKDGNFLQGQHDGKSLCTSRYLVLV